VPYLWFAPLDCADDVQALAPNTLGALMADRFEVYKREVVGRFFEDHFRRYSRQRSEAHTSELQSQSNLVCRLLLEKKKNNINAFVRMMPTRSASSRFRPFINACGSSSSIEAKLSVLLTTRF